jgi:phosphomevalonate kinase
MSADDLDWIDEPPSYASAVFETAFTMIGEAFPPLSITIDTRAFHDEESGRKLGLGSSAAAITSAVLGLKMLAGDRQPAALAAEFAHREMQMGGSGIDVATSRLGGVIRYSRKSGGANVVKAGWPDALALAVLWSGRSSKTSEMVARLSADCWQSSTGKALIKAAEGAVQNWSDGAESAQAGIQAYADRLLAFDVDHGIGIFDAGHDELYELAKASDVVYKPSGAGGGDIGIVLSQDAEAVSAFCAEAEASGFRKLDLSLDPTGAECKE